MKKRSVTVAGHRTSVSIEEPFWQALAEIAAERQSSVASLVESIDRERPMTTSLSAAVRLHVFDWYRKRASGLTGTDSGKSN